MTLIVLLVIFAISVFLYNIWNEYLNDPKKDKEFMRKYLKSLEEYKKTRKD